MLASQAQEHSKRTLGPVGWITHVLLLALMIFLAAWVLRWGWAEVLVAEPRNIMDRWQSGQAMPSDDERDRLDRLLARAQSLNSHNADIAFDYGRFAEWRALQHPLWTKEAHKYRDEAIGHFKRALDVRPSWGMAWVHLANSLVLNQQLHSGGMDALEKASILAPLETPVQQRVIWLGLSQWKVMDDELRGRTRSIIEDAIEYQQHLTVNAIVDYQFEEEFEDLFIGERLQMLLHRALAARNKRKQRK